MPAPGKSDEDLVLTIRRGDMQAFDILYGRFEARLFGYILRFLKDRSLAEDVFQDVFFAVLKDTTFDPERGRFSAWLFRVARNQCLQTVREGATRTEALTEERPTVTEDPESVHAEAAEVRAAIAALPDAQQQLLLLKQVGGLSYGEIAVALGVAEGTVKSRLHGATRAFRQKLQTLGRES